MELDIFGNQYDLQTRLIWDLNDLRLAITDRFVLKRNTTTIDGKVATQAFSEFYNTTFIAFANDVATSIAKYFDTYQLQNRTINEPIIFGETLQIVYRMLLAQGRKMSEHPTMAKSFSQIESEYNRSPRKVGDTLFKAIEKANAPEPEPETPNADNTPAEDTMADNTPAEDTMADNTQSSETTTNENTNINVNSNVSTELEIDPPIVNFKVGETQEITIHTNAIDFIMVSSNPNVVSVQKMKKTIRATGKGDAKITITAQVVGGERVTKEITCHVTQDASVNVDFGSPDEILENTYHYDETLPLSINGTIAYKKGDNDHDPLIKLVFDGKLQRWQVVGIKVTKWNTNGEPYAIYFMASQGAVANALGNMSLEQVIVDLIDDLFVKETPNMVTTIRNLFDEQINPLIQNEMERVPQYVQNEITYEIQGMIDRKIEDSLDTKFGEVIKKNMEQKIQEFQFSRMTPYHKTEQKPKWVGVIISNLVATNKYYEQHQYSRRLNTNGIEEQWLRLVDRRINDFHNNDELTQLFDSIEPFKSMDRMIIEYQDLKSIVGDSIYGKETFERLMSKSRDKMHNLWNGQWFSRGSARVDLFNAHDAWFVPLKKCHYIDIEFSLLGDDNNRYMLKCVGESEFSVNLKDYFPNATGIKTYYFRFPRGGWREFPIDDMTITSIVHPSFLNYYDTNLNIITSPMELDYVYVGAFLDVRATLPTDFRGAGTLGWFLAPKPMGTIYKSTGALTMKAQVQQYAKYMFGSNPQVGVNFKHMENSYQHLIELLSVIECGNDLKSWTKLSRYGTEYKWYSVRQENIGHETGMTLELGNKTGSVHHTNTSFCINSYRGIESFAWCFYHYLEGLHQQNGNKDIWYHLPHSHRKVSDLFNYDGVNLIKTDYSNRNLSTHATQRHHILANGLGAFEPLGSRMGRYYTYAHNNNVNEDRQILFRGYQNTTGESGGNYVGLSSDWHPSSYLNWWRAFRSCI